MRTTHHHALAHTRCTTIVRFNLRTDFLRSLRHCLRLLKFYCGDFLSLSLLSLSSSPLRSAQEPPALTTKRTRIFFDFFREMMASKICRAKSKISSLLEKKTNRCALTHNFSRRAGPDTAPTSICDYGLLLLALVVVLEAFQRCREEQRQEQKEKWRSVAFPFF